MSYFPSDSDNPNVFEDPLETDWTHMFRDWEDVGQHVLEPLPTKQPLDQRELDFCASYGIHFKNKLGSGGYGTVWRCEFDCTDEEGKTFKQSYACKVIDIKKFKSLGMDLHRSVSKMLVEADVTKDLDHKNIVRIENLFHIHDPFTGFPWFRVLLFMDMCDGDLNKLLKFPWSKLSEKDARAVMSDACQGLKCLHDLDISHLDIKPANILYKTDPATGDRCFKLTDFGMAIRFPTAETRVPSALLGTERYMPPTLDETGISNAKMVDIFSLGSTLAEMLVSSWRMESCRMDFWPPDINYPDPDYRHDEATMERLENKWRLSSSAANLIRKMTALDEESRATIDQVIADEWFDISQLPGLAEWVD